MPPNVVAWRCSDCGDTCFVRDNRRPEADWAPTTRAPRITTAPEPEPTANELARNQTGARIFGAPLPPPAPVQPEMLIFGTEAGRGERQQPPPNQPVRVARFVPAPRPVPTRPVVEACEARHTCANLIARVAAPTSVKSKTCDQCGETTLDGPMFQHRRAWARQFVPSKRMDFMGTSPWSTCPICMNQRVLPDGDGFHCSACGEHFRRPGAAHPTVDRPERDEAQLLEAIANAPDDDAPRRVLADVLLEKTDPRGEFIQLQLDAEAGIASQRAIERLQAVYERSANAWVPPGLTERDCEFRRGFIDSAIWPGWTDPNHFAWRTVTQLRVPPNYPESGQLTQSPLGGAPLKALRELRGCGPRIATWLLENPPPRLSSLELRVPQRGFTEAFVASTVVLLDRLPTINALALQFDAWGAPPPPELVRAAVSILAPRLFRLRLPLCVRDLQPVLETLRAFASHALVQLSMSGAVADDAWVEIEGTQVCLVAEAQATRQIIDLLYEPLLNSGLGEIDLVLQPSGERRRLPLD